MASVVYSLYTKFDDSSFCRSRDITGPQKLVGHVTITMPFYG